MDLLKFLPDLTKVYAAAMDVWAGLQDVVGAADGSLVRSVAISQLQATVNKDLDLQPGFIETLTDDALAGILDAAVFILNKAKIVTAPAATTTVPTGALKTASLDPATGQPTDAAAAQLAADNAKAQASAELNQADVGAPTADPPAAGGGAPAVTAGTSGPGSRPVAPPKG